MTPWIALGLVMAIAVVVLIAGFVAGMRYEYHCLRDRDIPDAERWDAAADLRDSRRVDRGDPVYRPWREL
jgi:hypothetical protein